MFLKIRITFCAIYFQNDQTI